MKRGAEPIPLLAVAAAPTRREFILRLYVTGATPKSARAVVNTRAICEEHLKGRYELEILDIADNIAVAMQDQIVAAPTLVKLAPLPLRRFIGDMSDVDRVLRGLGMRAADTTLDAAVPSEGAAR